MLMKVYDPTVGRMIQVYFIRYVKPEDDYELPDTEFLIYDDGWEWQSANDFYPTREDYLNAEDELDELRAEHDGDYEREESHYDCEGID